MRTFRSMTILALLALAGCSGAQERLGIIKRTPDEFAVVKRAPLQMPPDYSLRPPRPGAPRPQERLASDEARAAVLGEVKGEANVSRAEDDLIRATGGSQAPTNIRAVVDTDTNESSSEPVVKRLLGIGGKGESEGKTIDPAAEAARLKRSTSPKPATSGGKGT